MTTTTISSIRAHGNTACMTIDGATCGEAFCTYVGHVLVSALSPGDIVIPGDLFAHKNAKTTELIESVGAQICFLPPCSPDLNPIERMWSEIKEHLRDTKARTQQTLEEAIAHALQKATPQDARAWFNPSGYPTCQN